MASEGSTDDLLPEWVLEEDPGAYDLLKHFIKGSLVQELDAYLKVKSQNYRLGRRSFSCTLNEDPLKHKQSLLMHSCVLRSEKLVEYILRKYGGLIDVNYKEWVYNSGAWTLSAPLHIACASGVFDIVKLFVEAGANVNICNCCRETPLHSASRRGNRKILELLLDHGATINAKNHFGDTPLIASIIPCNFETTKFFLSRGADHNQVNNKGLTPMHVAAKMNDMQLVKEFLSYGISSSVFVNKDRSGTPFVPCPLFLTVCCWGFNPESEKIIEMLTSLPDCPIASKIDALLLLGSYHMKHICREIHWREAISLRDKYGIAPTPLLCIEEYGSRVEMTNLEDLEKVLQSDLEEAYQCLLIQERCLGYANDRVASTLRQVASTDLSETLWFRYLNMLLYQWSFLLTVMPVKPFSVLLSVALADCRDCVSRMLSTGKQPRFHRYIEFGMEGLKMLYKCISRCKCGQGITVGDFSEVIWPILGIFSEWLTSDLEEMDKPSEDLEAVGNMFVSEYLHVKDSTVLHILLVELYSRLPENELRLRNFFDLVPALLCWGADSAINAPFYGGYRPLHLASLVVNRTRKTRSGKVPIIPALLDHGVHLDAVSLGHNQTALDMCTNEEAKALLKPSTPQLLMCQAACAVVAGHIPYKDLECIPEQVKKFVALHDPNPGGWEGC